MGGLPDHIRVDVALRAPQDLHTAVYLVGAFELRANSLMAQFPTGPRRVARRSSGSPRPRPRRVALHSRLRLPYRRSDNFVASPPAEQQERRRQGLCFNCDEPYVRGHHCKRLFYLESSDFDMAEDGAVDAAPNAKPDDDLPPQDVTTATACGLSTCTRGHPYEHDDHARGAQGRALPSSPRHRLHP